MLTCAACGNVEPEGSRFCGVCGAPFVPADPQPDDAAAMEAPATLICASCGNEEPEGSRFCGVCGASFAPLDQELAPAAMAAAEEPSRAEPRPASPPKERRRLRWVAVGAVVALLAVGGGVAAALSLTGGDGSTEVTPTGEPLFAETTEPPAANPTLAESVRPRIVELVASQSAVSSRVRSLQAGVKSFAALRGAGDALRVTVAGTQGFVDAFVPASSTDTTARSLLQGALAAHLAYAGAISGLPPRPRSFTRAQAQNLAARAEQVQVAYATLGRAEPAFAGRIALNYFDHARLAELVGTAPPGRPASARRAIDLVPLLVGIRPDDPPGEGRCFGPYGRGSMRVSGVVHRGGYIQCGDDADGDPSRASGVYSFSGRTFPAGSRLARITGQAVIDEFSSPSQRGTSVTWTVFYDGAPICSRTVTWSGARPSHRKLDCKFPPSIAYRGLDLGRLRIQQVALLASSGSLWAGLLDPTIVVEVRR